jgi:regulator of protease activity HflC (stomatin/prohibitin superfamily)
MDYFKRNYGIILFLAITLTASMRYWYDTKERARVLQEGIYKRAQVTRVWFIKNEWKVNVSYRVGTSVYNVESIAARNRYSVGDSLTIKVLADKPEGQVIIIHTGS